MNARSYVQDLVDQATRKLRSRVNSMIARCVVNAVNDGEGMQTLKVTVFKNDVADGVEHFQPGGLYHHPGAGAEGIALELGAHAEHLVVILANERALRPTGKPAGSTGLYPTTGPMAGQLVVYVDPATGIVHAGSDAAADFVALAAKVMTELAEIRTKFNGHTHVVSGASAAVVVGPQQIAPANDVRATKLKAD